MTRELIPLAIHGDLLEGDAEALQRAEGLLQLPWTLTPVEAVPGSPTRVLALRERPPFIVDYALLPGTDNPDSVLAALYWVTHPEYDDPRSSLIIDQLKAVFGPDLKEITRDVSTVRFAEYD